MSPFVHSTGAPTSTAKSASLSFSGLDHFSPVTAMDPTLLDGPEWYQNPGHGHQVQLSPQLEHFSINFGSGFAAHSVPVTHEAMHQLQHPALSHAMNGFHHPYEPTVQPRLDDLGAISPLQATYPPYQTPYPDSTASSAPSEETTVTEAEEDKRKRNQAASARFRQKKKQREQHMLDQSREMQERTKKLETEVDTLKKENGFLKKLLVEKVDNMSDEDKAALAKSTALKKAS